MKLNIVFFGTPSFVIPLLEVVHKDFTVVSVVTTPDTIQGRKKILTASPIKEFAKKTFPGVPVLTPDNLNEIEKELQTVQPDLFVVAAYGKLIPQSILDIPKYGSLNIHPSLLPRYRGPSPIQTAILNGDVETGVSIIKMDAEMDHGDIISQWKTPIRETDTFETLHQTLFGQTAEKLTEIILDFVTETIQPQPQDENKVTFCQKTTRESGYFDIDNPPTPEILDRMIRGFYPWPTAWTRITMKNGEKKIVKFLPEKRMQLEGKNEVSVKDFLNGYPELKPQLLRLSLKN